MIGCLSSRLRSHSNRLGYEQPISACVVETGTFGISAGKDIRDEAKRLVESIARSAKDDPVLVLILDLASKNLAAEIDKGTANITQS